MKDLFVEIAQFKLATGVNEGDFLQKPSVQVIAKIAKALGVSMEDLVK